MKKEEEERTRRIRKRKTDIYAEHKKKVFETMPTDLERFITKNKTRFTDAYINLVFDSNFGQPQTSAFEKEALDYISQVFLPKYRESLDYFEISDREIFYGGKSVDVGISPSLLKYHIGDTLHVVV